MVEADSGPKRPRDRALRVRSVVVAAAAALALASCGAVMPGGGGSTGDGSQPTSASPAAAGKTVKVVFIGVDLDEVKKQTKLVTASVGDPKKQVEALEKWVNDNGGLGGRKLDAVFRMYDAQTDSPASEEKLCNQVAQDDKAFAVVLTGQYQSNARPCYAQRKTLMLDASLVSNDEALFEELAPYLWSPSFPEYNAFTASYIKALSQEKFFEGRKKVAIVAADTPVNRRTVGKKAVPQLKKLGIDAEVGWVDTTDIGTIYQGSEQAAITFASAGIDRVMFLGGSRLASIFATIAGSKQFKATYAISSFDNPSFFLNNPDTVPADTMNGMVGIGFHPPQDVADSEMPFPGEGVEKECLDIYEAAGITFETREAARVALPYCDSVRMLKLGADGVDGPLTAESWSKAVDAEGSNFQTASGFGNALGDGGHAAAGSYRVMRFADDCRCFVYEGDDVPFSE
ncbi:ABC transporter substrate-binding protein [Aeromicrobium wangtongii]|uniref:ABC transporter substrate-binding protein n=1 Tax=Aeromicrobium wangtongii TaxID=2969247 RepID=UPI002016FDCB|nr:hypothetical protein [Aeromicrobium wangtongii]MCL3818706.1 hypothetical protein [Aeromicrobium wangtongii]